MKKILACFLIFTTFSFQACTNQLGTNASGECPETPETTLTKKNVQEVKLTSEMTKNSGMASKNKAVGFAFEGKQGQKLTYKTNENICVWVYTPDNDLLNGVVLPKNGKYTIQIATSQGSTSFELAMGLDVADSSVNTATNSSSINSSNSSPSSSLSQEEAVNLIKSWQRAKRQIFARPFNRNLGAEILTGEAYSKNISNYDSSMNWLQNNNAYYTYGLQEVDKIVNFISSGNQATIEVVTSEERTFCVNGRPKRENTVFDKSRVSYNLQFDQGKWKISSYNAVDQIQRTDNRRPLC